MLAEIGGYTGLLLGVSVVNVTSYVERVLVALCRKKWKRRKKIRAASAAPSTAAAVAGTAISE